jgi:hypothetical protein
VAGRYKITGTITRETGEPASGVSIAMLGTETFTDDQGKFVLLVEKK